MSNDPNAPTGWNEIVDRLLEGDLSPEEEAALLAELPTVPAGADEWFDQALEEDQPLDLDELRATQDRANQTFDKWHASSRNIDFGLRGSRKRPIFGVLVTHSSQPARTVGSQPRVVLPP